MPMTLEDWKDRYYEADCRHREFIAMSGEEHRRAIEKLQRELTEALEIIHGGRAGDLARELAEARAENAALREAAGALSKALRDNFMARMPDAVSVPLRAIDAVLEGHSQDTAQPSLPRCPVCGYAVRERRVNVEDGAYHRDCLEYAAGRSGNEHLQQFLMEGSGG